MGHLIIVVLTMAVLPLASMFIDGATGSTDQWPLIGKWFLFWAAGVRLSIAGARQIAKPELTVTGIFGVTDRAAFPIAQELGFWNLTIGMLCIASLWHADWRVPLALGAGAFYLLAGIKHVLSKSRVFEANTAMVSDLTVAAILLGFAIASFI